MKKLLSLTFIVFTLLTTNAQYFQGFVSSNYAGTNGMYFNPATLADTRYRAYVNLSSMNLNFANNYAEAKLPYSSYQYLKQILSNKYSNKDYYHFTNQSTNTLDSIKGWKDDNSYLGENINGKAKYVNLSAEVRGPSFSYSWNNKNTIALGTRVMAGLQVNDIAEPFARFAVYGLDKNQTKPYLNVLQLDNSFGLNIGAYTEVSASYARKIIDLDKHYFTGGVSLKYYQGLAALFVQNKGVNVNFVNKDSLFAVQTDVKYGMVAEQFYGLLNPDLNNKRSGLIGKDLFPRSVLGKGYGFDLGFQYEYRPDIEKYKYTMDGVTRYDDRKVKYLYKIGFSIMNIGYIKYSNPKWVKYHQLKPRSDIKINDTAYWGQLNNLKLRNSQDLDSALGKVFGFKDTATSFNWYMPGSININFDYRVTNHFFVSGVLMQSITSKNGIGFRVNSLLGITPRIEFRWLEVSMPILATFGYSKLNVGLFLRTGVFFIGSDNIGGFLGSNNFNGIDLYTGATIPLFKGKPKDRDKDGVSDRNDHCIHVPGAWSAKGCPDQDGDGIPDDEDKCRTLPGPFNLRGCPDTDGDGVTDDDDLCPSEKGSVVNKGCPDRDGDGVYDKNDKCPDEFGKNEDGCPDRDNDGIIDSEDKCPDSKGPLATKGCPDSDNDGVTDDIDLCPDKAGKVENKGCPDTDNDGVVDNLDKCPDQPGMAKLDGCPDRDLDGVADKDDNCPDQYGDPLNLGCPLVAIVDTVKSVDLDAGDQDILKRAFDNLEFASGKSAVNPISKPNLDELAGLLAKHPEYKLTISGHTDKVGKPAANLKLSRDRAAEVKKYLVSKGVKAANIKSEGYGDTRPVAVNDNDEGRQKNRRVELKISE
ncbi:MAG: OmpA family protein [Bacteroidota bacterium]|nr:OmpA family protein [Bacteroidota bacterium]